MDRGWMSQDEWELHARGIFPSSPNIREGNKLHNQNLFRIQKLPIANPFELRAFPVLIQCEGQFRLVESKAWGGYRVHGVGVMPRQELMVDGADQAWLLRPNSHKTSVWREIFKTLRQHQGMVLSLFACALVIQILVILSPLLMAVALDDAIRQMELGYLGVIAVGIGFAALSEAVFGALSRRLSIFLEARVGALASAQVMDRVLSLPFLRSVRFTTGQLRAALEGVTEAIEYTKSRLWPAGIALMGGTAQLVVLAIIFPVGFVVAVVGALLLAGNALLFMNKQVSLEKKVFSKSIKVFDRISDLIHGYRLLKASGFESMMYRRWRTEFYSSLGSRVELEKINFIQSFLGEITTRSIGLMVLLIGAGRAMEGRMEIGALLASGALTMVAMTSVETALNSWSRFRMAAVQIAASDEVLSLEPQPDPAQMPTVSGLAGHIGAEDVWFRYEPEASWILKQFSLRASPGEHVHLAGPSGSGKSTTLRLLAGLLEPEHGNLSVGGRNPRSAREDLIYLPQFTQLLNASIRRNLEVFSCGASMDQLAWASEETGLEELLSTLPLGIDTILTLGGSNFSGGQRQLILLTACLASDRPILLLDEAMANLDWRHRAALARSELMKRKTIVYASHDGKLLL